MLAAPREDMLNGMGSETQRMAIAFTASLVCHLLVFSVLLYMQTHSVSRRPVESFISVSLVSVPEPSTSVKPKKPSPAPAKKEPTPPAETEAVRTNPNRQSVNVAAEPKKKVSLKKKTFKPETVKKRALEKMEERVETTSSERIARAIDKLKTQVKEEEAAERPEVEPEAPADTGGMAGDGRDAGGKRAELIDIYRVEVAFQIQKNWAFPDQLAEGRSDLQTLLVFKIMPNGEIKDLFFTDRSGNRHFDESAYRAVMKSNPVAPHPKGLSEAFVQMGLRFTPEGIK